LVDPRPAQGEKPSAMPFQPPLHTDRPPMPGQGAAAPRPHRGDPAPCHLDLSPKAAGLIRAAAIARCHGWCLISPQYVCTAVCTAICTARCTLKGDPAARLMLRPQPLARNFTAALPRPAASW